MTKPAAKHTESVILLHGLAETPVKMMGIEWLLRQAGYHTVNFAYPSTRKPVETLTHEHLATLVQTLDYVRKLHFVTHSLGGIMLKQYLRDAHLPNLGRVVMIGPPHHGSETFNYYRRNPLTRSLFGPVAEQSATDEGGYMDGKDVEADYEVGIIAGCIPWDPLSLFVMPWPHDGRTTVEGTRLKGMKDHITLPASHEFSPYNPLVAYETLQFLKHGSFNHDLDLTMANPCFWVDAYRPLAA